MAPPRRYPTSNVGDLAASLRGRVLLAGDPAYDQARRVWNAQWDRRPALIAQCESPSDVMQAVVLCPRASAADGRQGGRTQRDRQVDLRRRHHDRPDADELGAGRSRRATGTARDRCAVARPRPRDTAVLARHHGRHRQSYGSRRAHAGWRIRACRTPLRPGVRQPRVRRRRDGGRTAGACERCRKSRTALGLARRRRQLRRGDRHSNTRCIH